MDTTNKISNKSKIILASCLVAASGLIFFAYTRAQDAPIGTQAVVNYEGGPALDSDLDGLTDQAEVQIYGTDPKNHDTDDDGYYDGSEVLAGTDPLDPASIPGLPPIGESQTSSSNETPWAWYASRASGLVGFTLLYLSILLGLTIRVGFLRKFFAPLYAMQGHCWIAFQATLFALIHGVLLMFDKFIHFRLLDVFVPFATQYKSALVALGIIGFYLMVILTASSYVRKYISAKLWRALHFLNIFLYGAVIVHAYLLGTDMQSIIVRNIFVVANIFLILLMLINMFVRIKTNIDRKNAANASAQNPV